METMLDVLKLTDEEVTAFQAEMDRVKKLPTPELEIAVAKATVTAANQAAKVEALSDVLTARLTQAEMADFKQRLIMAMMAQGVGGNLSELLKEG